MGYVHRSVNSENVIYAASGKVKLIDFGSAIYVGSIDSYARSPFPWKYQKYCWIPPESVFFKVYGRQSDVWQAGIFLYELLSGGEHTFRESLEAGDQEKPEEL